jgi:hypothetical protein
VFLGAGSKHARREPVHTIDPHTGDPWFLRGETKPLPLEGSYAVTTKEFDSATGLMHTVEAFSLKDWVVPIIDTSENAASYLETGPIRLLFVDGLHTYEAVRTDIENWVPRVARGGVIIFDDYHNPATPGVTRAVDELLASGQVEPDLHTSYALSWCTKA